MTDALDAVADAPQTDTLAEQVEIPSPISNKMPADEAPPEPKVEAKKTPDQKRADDTKAAIDKVLDKPVDEKTEVKADKKAEPVKEEAKSDDTPDPAPKKEAADTKEATEAAPEAKHSAYKDAPSGFDDAAKKDWENTPEGVRGAVHRRLQEQERGIHKYRQEAEQFEPIRKYVEMAKQSGTDLQTALHKYTTMETNLRKDPIAGLQAVVSNLGLTKNDGSPVTLRDVAAKILGQTPDQAASQQEATISRLTNTISQLEQKIGGFSEHVERQQQQTRTTSAESEWNNFQRDNPRATELEPKMSEFLTRYPTDSIPVRERLMDAYKWAEAQNPSVAHTDPKPLVQTQTPPVANPAGQKSISGVGGNQKAIARKLSLKEAVDKAMSQHGA